MIFVVDSSRDIYFESQFESAWSLFNGMFSNNKSLVGVFVGIN